MSKRFSPKKCDPVCTNLCLKGDLHVIGIFSLVICFQMRMLDLQRGTWAVEKGKQLKVKNLLVPVQVTRSLKKCCCVSTVVISAVWERSFWRKERKESYQRMHGPHCWTGGAHITDGHILRYFETWPYCPPFRWSTLWGRCLDRKWENHIVVCKIPTEILNPLKPSFLKVTAEKPMFVNFLPVCGGCESQEQLSASLMWLQSFAH